jgi:hypothetical protein
MDKEPKEGEKQRDEKKTKRRSAAGGDDVDKTKTERRRRGRTHVAPASQRSPTTFTPYSPPSTVGSSTGSSAPS